MYHTIPFWLVEVSIEKLADNLWEFHFILFVTFPFFYYFIFVFNFHHFDYYVFQCVPPWVYPAWDSFCFLDLGTFPILGNFSAIISSNIFSGPFYLSSSGTPIMRMLVHLMLSQRSLRLCPFLFILFFYFLFCSSDFHYPVFQVTYPFFCLNSSVTDCFYHTVHLYLFFSSSRPLLNISCIFSIFSEILDHLHCF